MKSNTLGAKNKTKPRKKPKVEPAKPSDKKPVVSGKPAKASNKTAMAAPPMAPVNPLRPLRPKPKRKQPGNGRGRKPGDKGKLEANKGMREGREIRTRKAFEMRCGGATIAQIALALGVAPSTVHEDIEEIRASLRNESLDLAAQEREVCLQQIDDAISAVIPHIRGDIEIETVKDGKKGPIVITVEAYEARMKAAGALTRLMDRKSKLLGLDAPVKVEPVAPTAQPPEEALANAKAVLRKWGASFAPRGVQGETVDG